MIVGRTVWPTQNDKQGSERAGWGQADMLTLNGVGTLEYFEKRNGMI